MSLATSLWPDPRRSLMHLLGGRAVGAALGLGVTAVLWRTAGTEPLGQFLALVAMLEVLVLLTGCGLSGVVQRHLGPWLSSGAAGTGLVATLLVVRMVLATSAAAGLMLVGELTTQGTHGSAWMLPVPLLMAWVAGGSLQRALEEVQSALMQQDAVQVAVVVGHGLRMLALLGAVGLPGAPAMLSAGTALDPQGLTGAPSLDSGAWSLAALIALDLGVALLVSMVGLVWLWVRLQRSVASVADARRRWPLQEFARAWRLGLGFWSVQIMGVGMGTPVMRLLVAGLGGSTAVAVHGAAQAMADNLRNLQPLVLMGPWLRPMLVREMVADTRGERMQALLLGLVKLSMLAMLPVVFVLVFISDELLAVVAGSRIADEARALAGPGAQHLLAGLAVLAVLQGLHLAASMACSALERPRLAVVATTVAALAVPWVPLLWPMLGLWSVVVAGCIGEALWVAVVARGLGWSTRWRWTDAERAALRRHLPGWSGLVRLRKGLGLLQAAASDAAHWLRGSALMRAQGRSGAQAQLLKTAHRLDKGLALPQPRPGFGVEVAGELQRQLQDYERQHGPDWLSHEARHTLERHQAFLQEGRIDLPRWRREDLQAAATGSFESLVRSRRSIRQFGDAPLPDGALMRAVDLARHSPSVCNRSAARVWAVQDAVLRRRLLRHQNGHHGFGESAAALLVVTVRTEAFDTVGERHQGWIDGGLFAMTLIHALHHQGLGTCCLNWSVTPDVDRAFKRDAGLPPLESVVMLLAVGTLPTSFTVAHSPRRPLSEVLQVLQVLPVHTAADAPPGHALHLTPEGIRP